MATEYEQIKSAGIDPQVAELAEYHSLGAGGRQLVGVGWGHIMSITWVVMFDDKQEDTRVVFEF